MEEIKSIRARVKNEQNPIGDIKVTLFSQENDIKVILLFVNGKRKEYTYNRTINTDLTIDDYINKSLESEARQEINQQGLNKQASDYFDIVQDPWDEIPPVIRWFGKDPYYLNNGAEIYIRWENQLDKNKDSSEVGGLKWSNDDGSEKKEVNGINKSNITKYIYIKAPKLENIDENIDLGIKDSSFKFWETPLSDSENSDSYSGKTSDRNLIKLLIDKWKTKVPEYEELDLCDNDNQPCFIIRYKSPLEIGSTKQEPDSQDNDKKVDIKLSVVLPDDLKVNAKEDIPNLDIWIGEPPSETDEFDFGPDEEIDLSILGDEFTEDDFQGDPWDDIELERDIDSELEFDGSGVVNTGGSNIISPNTKYSSNSILLSGDLKNISNSSVLTYQSLGGKKKRDVKSDIVNTKGDRISGADIVNNMNNFIKDVLEPFSSFLKSNYPNLYKNLYITSAIRGYVPSGGSLTSQHMKGQAIDCQILRPKRGDKIQTSLSFIEANKELLNAILEWYKDNPVGYDQILFETRDPASCWIHWSYQRNNNRLQLLRFSNDTARASRSRFKSSGTVFGKTPEINTTGSYVLPPVSLSSLGFDLPLLV